MRTNTLRQQLTDGNLAINAWLSFESAHAAEVLSYAGFDSVTVDLQHGMFGLDTAIALLRAVSAGPATPLARSSALNHSEIGKLLDAGAYGIICPGIDTAQDAADFVECCRYPAVGTRSFGPARGVLYGGNDYVDNANDEVMTWAMIESCTALRNASAIYQTPGLDAIYLGPNDLAFSLGEPVGGRISPRVLEILSHQIALAHDHGLFVGVFTADAQEGRILRDLGADLVTPGNDAAFVKAASAERIRALRA